MSTNSTHKKRLSPIVTFRIIVGLLLIMAVVSSFMPIFKSVYWGVLPPMVVMIVRSVLLQIAGGRIHRELLLHALLLSIWCIFLWRYCDFSSLWHHGLQLLLFLASAWGIFVYRFTGLFMFVSCGIVGAFLF